jgi:hypothetical protein
MLDRPIEQSHDIIVGRARAIVEPYQPMHRPETDGALQSAPTARKLTRHREYQSSPRPARLVELGVSARQRKCSDKAVPVLLAEFALQPAMRVVDPTRASTIIGNWQRQNRLPLFRCNTVAGAQEFAQSPRTVGATIRSGRDRTNFNAVHFSGTTISIVRCG